MNSISWDRSVDLLIVGSGGGGLVAALAALDSGIEPLVIEKQSLVGGSTGLSGGMVWLPNNPLMRADGIADSHEDGLAYFDDVVGDIGQPSSPARREMFLTAGYEMISFLLRKGVRLVRCPGWSDYYPNNKGGNEAGRAIEGIPYNAAALGNWSDKVQPSMAKSYGGFVLKTNELRAVQYFNRSPRAFATATKVFARTRVAKLRGQELLTNGASLIGQMLKALIDLRANPPIWTDAAMQDLIVDDGRVIGARVTRNGTSVNIEARKGVLLAAGGFSRNADMRRRYSGDQPNDARWSIANAGDTGEVLEAAIRLGAKTDLMDEAWWLPSIFIADGGDAARALGSGRQRPGAIYVDGTGKRFCNESNSYVEVGKAMYANKAVPCWMVFDEGYIRRYVSGANPFKKRSLPEELIERGAVLRGKHHRRSRAPDGGPARHARADGQALQWFCGQGPRPRFRARPVGVQRLPGRSGIPHECRARSARPGTLLRHQGCSRRCRNMRRADRQRVRAGSRRERPRDRGPVRDGQHHRDGDGPKLSRSRRKHRLHDGLRLRGRPPRRRFRLTPSRRKVP